ncbi:MAG: hypothetical protein HLUCCX14_07805 [Marinobacter excellens HL-55]|uniref:Uncharacterized protein n=1 Tax=Marinobacter excellens HL-55 TaxID=1305731 RepID=A0A0P7ZII7_9GAMM|nr:MAG: hypothetical protein HLUCCX14_07805 [Marinobacter excellens HL-55]
MLASSKVPSVENLLVEPIASLPKLLSQSLVDISRNARSALELNLQRAYRKACYEGDLARVDFFVFGMREHLPCLASKLLSDKKAVSWAAFGNQPEVIRLICSNQNDSDFFGYDYDLALALFTLAREQNGSDRLSTVLLNYGPDDAFSSSLSVICQAVKQSGDTELIRVLEPLLAAAIDRQISQQITR